MTPRTKPQSCVGCACHSHGTDFSDIEGTGSSGVMVVAEASGEMEARDQLPLRPYAPSGSVFERVLRRMSIDRQQLSVANVVRCRPKNNWLEGAYYEYDAINHCRPNLDAAIRERKPRCIVALGGVALRELTGQAGESRGISHLCGYPLPLATTRRVTRHECGDCTAEERTGGLKCLLCNGTGYWETDEPAGTADSIPVIGDFHPAFIRRGKASHQGVFARVLQRAMNIAVGRDRQWLWNVDPMDRSTHGTLNYLTHPSIDDANTFLLKLQGSSGAVISYDLETFESTSLDEDAREGFSDTNIRLVQFSGDVGEGLALPWEGAYRAIAQRILHLPNVKCGHNTWLFDQKVLKAVSEREGVDYTPRGPQHDTLQMFHHWQPDLPAHLQFAAQFVSFPFPWKHLAGTDLAFYGCADVDATLRLYNMLEATLKRDGLYGDDVRGYLGQVYHVRPVLAAMEDRGLPIDDAARRKLDAEFDVAQRELGKVIAARAPAQCKRVYPKGGYKGVPPEVKALDPVLWSGMDAGNGPDVQFTESGEDGEQYCYQKRMFDEAAVVDGNPVVQAIERWCRVYDFNPNSGKQLIEYMKHRKHKVPKDKHREDADGNQKDTTAAKELLRLATRTGDDFYLKVIEYRGLTKMRGTYVDGFKPHADGAVHTTFTFDTGIGQLSSRNPNIQNFPKLKPTPQLAKAMREMVAARPGHIIGEIDYKSCHALTLGFLAESEPYMRLARLDIHSFTAGHFLKCWDGHRILSEPSDALMERFKWLKSDPERKRVRDDQAKHAILGIGNGLKAKGLYERYMESFPGSDGLKVAKKFLVILEELFPEVFAWQRRVQKLAHEQQWLRTEFGHIRRFYEVFRWDVRKGDWGHGDQAEAAISFWLSNIAFGHIREGLKALHATGMARKYGLFNNVHDSYMFEFPEVMQEEFVSEVPSLLLRPSTVLRHPRICPSGLVIDVETSVGRDWAHMEEVKHAHANANSNPQPADLALVFPSPAVVATAQ